MIFQQYGEQELIRILKDADCPSATIESFIKCHEDKKYSENLQILSKHRRILLEQIHETQHSLECLDYLIYNIRKKGER